MHVVPGAAGWAVEGEGRTGSIHSNKKDALQRARQLARSAATGQIAIHDRSGHIEALMTFGLPKVQNPPHGAGNKSIERAVIHVTLERLKANHHPVRE